MITLEDCIGLSGLTEEEIMAIAEHDRMPETAAAALGHYLAQTQGGLQRVGAMIVDDVRAAQARADKDHVQELLHVLHHFLRTHPEAAPDVHPWSAWTPKA